MSWEASAYIKRTFTAPNGERLARAERNLLIWLSHYYNDEEGGAWPGLETLARDATLSTKQVGRLLDSCARKGIILIFERRVDMGDGRGRRVLNFYTFPALDTANTTGQSSAGVRICGDISTKRREVSTDIPEGFVGTFPPSHNKEVNGIGNDTQGARASLKTSPSEAEMEEVNRLSEALRRGRLRIEFDTRVVPNWRYYKWLAKLCFKAGDEAARRILTDRQHKSLVTVMVELLDAGADLERLRDFNAYWQQDWKSRQGKMPPTPPQVREFWTEAMSAEVKVTFDDERAEGGEEDRSERLRQLRGGQRGGES